MKRRKREIQRLIDENNQLRKQLKSENQHYYEDLIVYMRAHTLFHDDRIVEENLIAILQDLIDAQQNGMDAETYFGKDPAQTGAEMLKAIPINIVDFAWFNLKLMMMLVLLTLLPSLSTPEAKLDGGNLLLVNITILIATWSILWIVGSNAFNTPSRTQKVGFFIGGGAIFAGTVVFFFFFKTSWQITIPPPNFVHSNYQWLDCRCVAAFLLSPHLIQVVSLLLLDGLFTPGSSRSFAIYPQIYDGQNSSRCLAMVALRRTSNFCDFGRISFLVVRSPGTQA